MKTISALIVALVVLLVTVDAQPKEPPLLGLTLRPLSGVRLLDPPVDLAGEYTVEDLKKFGYWPPWIIRDLDRDRQSDVAAVVVKPGPIPLFGVVAVHARTPHTVHWVVPLRTD